MAATSGGKPLDCKMSSPLPPKVSFNFSGGLKVFKFSFARFKFYAKAAAIVVFFVATAANINLDLSGPLKTTTLMLPVVLSAFNVAVESRLTSLEFYLGKLSLLIKFLVESVDALVVLVTKLLFILPAVNVSVKKSVAGLAEQNKGLTAIAICERACVEDVLDNNDMDDDDDNDDENKDFSVYDNTFDVIMYL
ncbi:hypothetical protein G9A89_001949 [Geosiphon pyriformis]|nr:hypothetical protein G9A89_001949 [Geosiphon pyriformis]